MRGAPGMRRRAGHRRSMARRRRQKRRDPPHASALTVLGADGRLAGRLRQPKKTGEQWSTSRRSFGGSVSLAGSRSSPALSTYGTLWRDSKTARRPSLTPCLSLPQTPAGPSSECQPLVGGGAHAAQTEGLGWPLSVLAGLPLFSPSLVALPRWRPVGHRQADRR